MIRQVQGGGISLEKFRDEKTANSGVRSGAGRVIEYSLQR
jgi:hypothetical protein